MFLNVGVLMYPCACLRECVTVHAFVFVHSYTYVYYMYVRVFVHLFVSGRANEFPLAPIFVCMFACVFMQFCLYVFAVSL